MTEGRDGISLAHGMASKFTGVALRLPLVAAMLLFTALVAGTTGTSYAKKPPKRALLDTVVVSNYGSAFGGSIETFSKGAPLNSKPFLRITGTNTLLGIGTGPTGDAQSSLDGDIVVGVPLVLLPIGFPNGFVEVFSPGSNDNSEPKSLIGDPTGFDVTGVNLGQGVGFENPFDGVHPFGVDILAVANTLPLVTAPDLHIPELGLCAPNAPGFSLGTITEYDHETLAPGLNVIPPFNDSPVNGGANPATIGGCDTYLAGPVGLAFDAKGFLYAVNEGFVPTTSYVTVYEPGAHGNAIPIAIVGTGALVNPLYVAVASGPIMLVDGVPLPQDTIYVTDVGDNSIKIFAPFDPATCFTPALPFGCFGTQTGTISGGSTKLKRPEGIALSADGNLYVVNNNGNSLAEFADIAADLGGGDIAPTFMLPGVIGGKAPAMNFPVGVALPAFPPPPL